MIDIEHIIELARLYVTEEEREKFKKQLPEIIEFFKNLEELDTENILPIFHTLGVKNVMREDKMRKFEDRELILENAPEREEDFFKVKRVIEEI